MKKNSKAMKNAAPRSGAPKAAAPLEVAPEVKAPVAQAAAIKPILKEETAIKAVLKEETAIKTVEKGATAIQSVTKKEPAVNAAVKEAAPVTVNVAVETKEAEAKPVAENEVKATKPAAKKAVAKKAPRTVKEKADTASDSVKEKKPAAKKVAAASKTAKTKEVASMEAVTPPPYKKKVALIGSECAPFAKTGGLADVLGALPKSLNLLDVEATVFLPFHKVIKDKYRMEAYHVTFFYINLGWRTKFVGVERLELDGVTYYFIDNEEYFGGPIYMGQQPEGEQYAFFCRAVLEAMLRMEYIPDVIHANDWQTATIPMLLRTQYQGTPLGGVKTLYTIHNMMYQGMYGFDFVQSLLGVDTRYYTPEFIEANGCANFMKAGLVFGDKISTVSPTYAQELKDPYYAYGLSGILNARAHDTVGILNGIDTDEYNSETDNLIPAHYTLADLKGKAENKQILMEKLGLHYNKDTPLIGMVSRLTSQKGFDLVKSVFHELMTQNVSIILLGTGDKEYEAFFGKMENEYKGRVCAYIGYNNEVAHQVYAASDLFLMPSKFEPCGLSQMIAQRYGTLPIARETGGLKDTVIPYNEYTGEGTGFTFTNYNSHDMLDIIKYALSCLSDPKKRDVLIKNAMSCDNSFAVSAQKYRDLYYSL